MRRPVMYLAGLLLATGASLALAGPASAAPARHHHHGHHHCYNNGWDNGWYYSHSDSYLNGNTYNGLNILNGVLNGGGLI